MYDGCIQDHRNPPPALHSNESYFQVHTLPLVWCLRQENHSSGGNKPVHSWFIPIHNSLQIFTGPDLFISEGLSLKYEFYIMACLCCQLSGKYEDFWNNNALTTVPQRLQMGGGDQLL